MNFLECFVTHGFRWAVGSTTHRLEFYKKVQGRPFVTVRLQSGEEIIGIEAICHQDLVQIYCNPSYDKAIVPVYDGSGEVAEQPGIQLIRIPLTSPCAFAFDGKTYAWAGICESSYELIQRSGKTESTIATITHDASNNVLNLAVTACFVSNLDVLRFYIIITASLYPWRSDDEAWNLTLPNPPGTNYH